MSSIANYVVRDVVGLEAEAPCKDAAALMAQRQIGAVAVRQDGKIVGVITERDLVARILSRGLDCTTPIVEAMRRDVPVISPEVNEVECAELMKDHATRHLLVADTGRAGGPHLHARRDADDARRQAVLIEQMSYIQGY
jgi:CBS domain-containing protein